MCQLVSYLTWHVEFDVRPIAVTNAIAKIAEKFVSSYFNDYYDDYTDVISLEVFTVVQLLMLF